MSDLFKYDSLQEFFSIYQKAVLNFLNQYDLDISELVPDHLGALTHNSEEFESVTTILLSHSQMIKEIQLNNRRVRVFKLNHPLLGDFTIPKIEIFEPKPESDLAKLRYGIEHISFTVKNFDNFASAVVNILPIAKQGQVGTSKFMKTEIINTVEIEFRSDSLGEEYA
ncbi:MAG: hypothetical protein UT34_C0001G0507 [candidate division WS6 bacterium GW2011_GWF2_39_15]|uniref:VOC family protein n=1 Tax=candidate division WS6 bacterium GW2011_GWF2_39_15 TaxID=1619100 RepID=A0A0G0N0U4_9BACT|nr:MAG: hypothetical protein UT34_C0001G0507 [candidate division WS6 bacterium GW2011_GWF2_39_15]